IVGGQTPFECPVVTEATVVDSSHLALTLSPSTLCPGDTAYAGWSHRFELGLQREGHHKMTVTILLASDPPVTVVTSVDFLVYHDPGDPPPPDSLEHLLSPSRPNPFVNETRFSVSTDAPEEADVAVFDTQGRRVSHVFHGRLPVGTTQLAWNGKRDD